MLESCMRIINSLYLRTTDAVRDSTRLAASNIEYMLMQAGSRFFIKLLKYSRDLDLTPLRWQTLGIFLLEYKHHWPDSVGQ